MIAAILQLLLLQSAGPLPPDDVVWERRPTSAEIDAVIPNTRYAWNVSFVIHCTIAPTGDLAACFVPEGPDGVPAPTGAVKLARYFKAGPVSRSGLSTAGRPIRIPMKFTSID